MNAFEKHVHIQQTGEVGSLRLDYPDGHSFELCSGVLVNDPGKARTEIARWAQAVSQAALVPDLTMGMIPTLETPGVSV